MLFLNSERCGSLVLKKQAMTKRHAVRYYVVFKVICRYADYLEDLGIYAMVCSVWWVTPSSKSITRCDAFFHLLVIKVDWRERKRAMVASSALNSLSGMARFFLSRYTLVNSKYILRQ